MSFEALEHQHRNIRAIRGVVTSMRALAAVQVRQGIEILRELRQYERGLRRALARLPAPGTEPASPMRVMLVAIGSDQGLCGRFTERLIEEALDEVKRLDATAGPIICVGERTRDRMQMHGASVSRVQRAPVSLRSVDIAAQSLMSLITEAVEEAHCDAVRVVYTRHEGSGQGTPRVRKIYPVTPGELLGKAQPRYGNLPLLHEPHEKVTNDILFEWVYAAMYRALVESLTAEQDARLRTTDRATRTVDQRLEELRLEINHEWQHLVTEEILEIVSGVTEMS